MSALKSIKKPVHWYEGMLLSPQHFQQNNLYMEQQILHMMQRTSPYYYGVIGLSFDLHAMSAAENKLVKVNYVHAIMEDGTEVTYESGAVLSHASEKTTSLSLELNKPEAITPMCPFFIYLAVAKLNDNKGNNTELRRYHFVKTPDIADIYDTNNKIEIDNLETHLQLFGPEEPGPGYSYIPIAKFQKKHDGRIERLNYTPPCLWVTEVIEQTPANSPLWKNISKKLAELRTKANDKREYYTQGNSDAPLGLKEKQELVQISQCLPGLQIMVNSRRCHPYDFYLALVNMTASLSVFLADGKFGDYENYQHNDLDKIFKHPLADLDKVITQIDQPVDALNFTRNMDGEFTYQFSEAMEQEYLMVSFRLSSGVQREQLKHWIENACICTTDVQQQVFFNRLTGIDRTQVTEFQELDMTENAEELFYLLSLSHPEFTRGTAELMQPALKIVGTDQKLEPYAPAAISWFRKRDQE